MTLSEHIRNVLAEQAQMLQQFGVEEWGMIYSEGWKVNIQIRENVNTEAKAEVRGRISGLLMAMRNAEAPFDRSDEARENAQSRFQEEVRAFYEALLGVSPTEAEMKEMVGIE